MFSLFNRHGSRLSNSNIFSVSVFENEGKENLPNFQDRPFTEPLYSIEIAGKILEKALDKVKETKSKGVDNIHPILVKVCKKALIPPLKIIYTKSQEEEKVWDIWKVGHISTIHKNGSRSKAESFCTRKNNGTTHKGH